MKIAAQANHFTMDDNHDVVLFETNIGHAGEFADSILQKLTRQPGRCQITWLMHQPIIRSLFVSLCNICAMCTAAGLC